ncbi:lipopolysaccharide-induced tumor necrosis factor-alpha factor homolog [Aricia agestis]|uniref:lipopolysaccharide-induced tumor necrosis factor-alpha factor homolog n=1 Tax=Aricia agestis TaxID=91739 RepID=UPI001C206303|nr:lipopolysaccharide-induced tumor necrosis factor-alpha factor homolog [Aricia agestis]
MMDTNPYQPISPRGGNDVCIEMDILRVGSEPVGMRCPHCQEDVMTRATYKNSTLTHIVAAVLGLLFWWLCCCVLPYVTKRWKDVEHYCPRCAVFLGAYTRKTII